MFQHYTRSAFLLTVMAFLSLSAFAQDQIIKKQNKVTVIIKGTDEKGEKVYKKIEKTGDDARNFNVDEYVNLNTKGLKEKNVNVHIDIDTDRPIERRRFKHTDAHNEVVVINLKDTKGFLGVSEDEQANNGMRVFITKNSGAAKAGLKSGDIIMQLNDKPIKEYSDISAFMKSTKPDDNIQVRYERDGVVQSTTATLGKQEQIVTKHFTHYQKEKEACLGVYTSTHREESQKGAVISDFTPVSAAKDVKMQLGDVITSVNGVAVKSHQELWDEIAKYKPKQIVTVYYNRNEEPLRINATLNACKPNEETIITVPTVTEQVKPADVDLSEKRQLQLTNFSASPNPIQDMVHIQFQSAAAPTTISLYDITGRVLFTQNMTDFGGMYSQRFDLSNYAKGVVVVQVVQDNKVFAKRLVVN